MTQRSENLPYLVGTAVTEITPPLEVGFLMSSVEERWAPFESIRLPLNARALSISCRGQAAVVVSLDLLGLADSAVGGMDRFKRDIVRAAGGVIHADGVILACTHSHTAPESIGLTDLYRSARFRDWISMLSQRIGEAVRSACLTARPARLSFASGAAPGLSVHRRIRTTHGIVLSHPEPDPATVISWNGARDDSVKVLAFVDQHERTLALMVNASCHPVHEMCMPHVSPDYPGILASALEQKTGGVVLFLNGAAGNINPPTVSAGPAASERHAAELARVVEALLSDMHEQEDGGLALVWRPVTVAGHGTGNGDAGHLQTRVASLGLGQVGLAFLAGEPFAETGLWLQEHSPFAMTIVAGYADAYLGYVPTDEAFAEGGYETGPGKWSRVLSGSEPIIRREALLALNAARLAVGPERFLTVPSD